MKKTEMFIHNRRGGNDMFNKEKCKVSQGEFDNGTWFGGRQGDLDGGTWHQNVQKCSLSFSICESENDVKEESKAMTAFIMEIEVISNNAPPL